MKKIIAIMLALAFVLAFSACKKADDDNSGADETSTVSSAEATSIEADSKTQEYIDNFTNSTIENPAESIEIAGQNVSASAGQSVTVPVTVTENAGAYGEAYRFVREGTINGRPHADYRTAE